MYFRGNHDGTMVCHLPQDLTVPCSKDKHLLNQTLEVCVPECNFPGTVYFQKKSGKFPIPTFGNILFPVLTQYWYSGLAVSGSHIRCGAGPLRFKTHTIFVVYFYQQMVLLTLFAGRNHLFLRFKIYNQTIICEKLLGRQGGGGGGRGGNV